MAVDPVSDTQTEDGHALPDAAHDIAPTDNEKSEAGVDSSNASTLDASNNSPTPNIKPDGDVADEKAPPEDQPTEVRTITGFRWVVVVLAILSSTFLFALDNTVVADVEPNIVESFGQIQKLPWLPIAFLVSAVSTNLIWGKIYGQFNAKWLYVVCVFLFEIGSAVCGAAPTMNAFIGGRVLAGLGGAGMYIGVMTLLSVNTTEHERPLYIGMTGLTWGLGTVLGPIIGGAFAISNVGWRFAFYINLFIGAVCAPVYLFMLPPFDPRPGVPYKTRISELDFLGTLLMVGACVAGVMAISFGGIIYPWNSGQTIACFVVSGVLFIVFGLQQVFCVLTTEVHRIFPVQFLKNRTLIILFMQMSAAVTVFFVPIYFIPLFFQFAKNDSAVEAGVRLLPLVCFLVFSIILNGALMSKYGYYMPWYLAGSCLALIGSALMYTVNLDTSVSRIYGYTILLGIGAGMYAQASFAIAQVKVHPYEIPSAIGFIALAQTGGATIALDIANSVFLNQATNGILAIVPQEPRSVVQGAISGAGSTFFQTLDPSVKIAVLGAVTHAISQAYILCMTGAALSIVLACFMSREKVSTIRIYLLPFHYSFHPYTRDRSEMFVFGLQAILQKPFNNSLSIS
ncbi:hypothetical protein MMC17_004798 [Xylographa soralifera]|nr:hypothetical protein [Xylographa soralifera]